MVSFTVKRCVRPDLEEIAVAVHHEQNHQVHLSFGEPFAVDDGTWKRPFHRHSVLHLTQCDTLSVNGDLRYYSGATQNKEGQKFSPLCAVSPPEPWLQWTWMRGVDAAPPCCESPATSGSAAEPPELDLASRSLTTQWKNVYLFLRTNWTIYKIFMETKAPDQPRSSSSSYPVALRCRSECRRCGCSAAVPVVFVRNAVPGRHTGASYTGVSHLNMRPDLGWLQPHVHQAGTPDSPPPWTSTHLPWGGGRNIDVKQR